ncbi:MAG: hypothetical protein ACM3QZ_04525 [Solirubrobacterales bacterium]
MQINIALCPHFHQPHFQLYRTREEAFANSYLPWLELLEAASEQTGFYINLHFSGPFMTWMQREKPWYLERMKKVVAGKTAGLIGGLADEPFIQLSSRPDDIYYQMRQYEALTSTLFGVDARQWEGVHVVEREVGEWLLSGLARGAGQMGAPPVIYLDAETCYESYYAYPGGQYDYCRKHFGFSDAYSKTTAPHIPEEMLFYGLRDEIGGQSFIALPVHTEFRYRFLKRQFFGEQDRTTVKPAQYLFYIKDAAERAAEMAQRLGKRMEPVVVVFEDAEKFGQWSKDPQGDSAWMMEFIRLVLSDPEVRFTGMADYVRRNGYFDTYPAATSHSYPEWENWMAKRGIRGMTMGDERLRKLVAHQRTTEQRMEAFENLIAAGLDDPGGLPEGSLQELLMDSPRRYEMIRRLVKNALGETAAETYDLIQRARHLAYQEDPRWANRHPSYGSCAYFDAQGLAYLELAERELDTLAEAAGAAPAQWPEVTIADWDLDGVDDLIVRTPFQTVVIDLQEGSVLYHHGIGARAETAVNRLERLRQDMSVPVAYSEVLRVSHPLVMTEADSDLAVVYDTQGGRIEQCRNSGHLRVLDAQGRLIGRDGGAFHPYTLAGLEAGSDAVIVRLVPAEPLGDEEQAPIRIEKTYTIQSEVITLAFTAQAQTNAAVFQIVPELVCTMAPSDEVDFEPVSYLRGAAGAANLKVYGRKTETDPAAGTLSAQARIEYICRYRTGGDQRFTNQARWQIETQNSISGLDVYPAVESYYRGHVFPEQSQLGYDSSGIRIEPCLVSANGLVSGQIHMDWQLDCEPEKGGVVIPLLGNANE